ncbi:hypothetical protein PSQ19_06085 [Devosia algicola]|uniref:Uncharacterized protein n=1 Tax=Devosia algicola TaxID=3026418 RepID=A0ABY7YR21_9HYPH|nr:hypothetical protein [Devosia algicola]WDR03637.1 hypothetical protein PSQ19_06085 [Devosia algicola]
MSHTLRIVEPLDPEEDDGDMTDGDVAQMVKSIACLGIDVLGPAMTRDLFEQVIAEHEAGAN